jgi:hypothetical protein
MPAMSGVAGCLLGFSCRDVHIVGRMPVAAVVPVDRTISHRWVGGGGHGRHRATAAVGSMAVPVARRRRIRLGHGIAHVAGTDWPAPW